MNAMGVRAFSLRLAWFLALPLAFCLVAGCSDSDDEALLYASTRKAPTKPPVGFYGTVPISPRATPDVFRLTLPEIPGLDAIWGGTGRDKDGHIWFGACVGKGDVRSAHLLEYDPGTKSFTDRGDVVSALKECGVYREGEQQAKIHSKIWQAADGHLYFASMDERDGDFKTGAKPPTWGGHLWRLRMPGKKWEHLLATPEALIAVSGRGERVYALGFFGHKLYQYHCRTAAVQSVEVGSVDAHISRNFMTDSSDHAYVPQLRRPGESGAVEAALVEFDENLKEVGRTPLENYFRDSPNASHGITAIQTLADHSIVFSTALGYLYRIRPNAYGPARVQAMGWLHPQGERYVASLFTFSGARYVIGLATESKDTHAGKYYDWVVYHLGMGTSLPAPFRIAGEKPPSMDDWLLYGSMTRDNQGGFYIVGTDRKNGKALALRVDCPK